MKFVPSLIVNRLTESELERCGDHELDRQPKIQATVDGVPLFECQYGTHNAKYAIRIDKSLRTVDHGWMGD